VHASLDASTEAHDSPGDEDLPFSVTVDDQAGAFVATADGVDFGAVTFLEKGDRVVLLATSILPGFRGRGLAMALIREVLDTIAGQSRRVTVRCPVFHTFIERNPEYGVLLDPTEPGMGRHSDA
jgi:predicted GNAT family acetyltransferase